MDGITAIIIYIAIVSISLFLKKEYDNYKIREIEEENEREIEYRMNRAYKEFYLQNSKEIQTLNQFSQNNPNIYKKD